MASMDSFPMKIKECTTFMKQKITQDKYEQMFACPLKLSPSLKFSSLYASLYACPVGSLFSQSFCLSCQIPVKHI